MVTPPPGDVGGRPAAPEPSPHATPTPARVVDVVVAVVLWLGLTVGSLVVGALAPLLALASDGCGSSADDGALICEPEGSVLFFAGLGLLWSLLLVGVLLSAFRMVRATRTGRPVWPWPFAGLGIGLLGVALLVLVMVVITS